MAKPGTITMKLDIDTTEAEAKIAKLRKEAEDLRRSLSYSAGGYVPGPVPLPPSPWAINIENRLRGMSISESDAAYLIESIRCRTR